MADKPWSLQRCDDALQQTIEICLYNINTLPEDTLMTTFLKYDLAGANYYFVCKREFVCVCGCICVCVCVRPP